MSGRHPIIAIPGSSGAGTSTVTKTFQNIFRREGLKSAIIEGDSYHRYDRKEMKAKAAEAEGKAVTDRVAMVLTDLEMPEMDGFTLTRNIKQDARFSGLPVVIHSSLSGSANEDHVRSVGADGYVAKFVAEGLAETIRRVLPH